MTIELIGDLSNVILYTGDNMGLIRNLLNMNKKDMFYNTLEQMCLDSKCPIKVNPEMIKTHERYYPIDVRTTGVREIEGKLYTLANGVMYDILTTEKNTRALYIESVGAPVYIRIVKKDNTYVVAGFSSKN